MLTMGSRGDDVRNLQLRLKAAGFEVGAVDGAFGPKTLAALKAFQTSHNKLAPTGVLDPETDGALNQALVIRDSTSPAHTPLPAPVVCDPTIWQAFLDFVKIVTQATIGYGPGRGLFVNGKFMVTYGAGSLNAKTWATHRAKTYPSFHCTSLANFFLGWLLKYNQDYTHSGNVPSVFKLLEQSADLHPQEGGGTPYRGYGPYCTEIVSDGSTLTRVHVPNEDTVMDIRELHARRAELPTFVVCGQSTHLPTGWNMWHHVVIFAIDHASPGSPMYRLAADGFKDAAGYSGNVMKLVEITPDNFAWFSSAVYRAYGVNTTDGTYGDKTRPIAAIAVEP
jgi:hypothetical protein